MGRRGHLEPERSGERRPGRRIRFDVRLYRRSEPGVLAVAKPRRWLFALLVGESVPVSIVIISVVLVILIVGLILAVRGGVRAGGTVGA